MKEFKMKVFKVGFRKYIIYIEDGRKGDLTKISKKIDTYFPKIKALILGYTK